jgi:hypothetical protein
VGKHTGHAEGDDADDEEQQLDAPLLDVQHLLLPTLGLGRCCRRRKDLSPTGGGGRGRGRGEERNNNERKRRERKERRRSPTRWCRVADAYPGDTAACGS